MKWTEEQIKIHETLMKPESPPTKYVERFHYKWDDFLEYKNYANQSFSKDLIELIRDFLTYEQFILSGKEESFYKKKRDFIENFTPTENLKYQEFLKELNELITFAKDKDIYEIVNMKEEFIKNNNKFIKKWS